MLRLSTCRASRRKTVRMQNPHQFRLPFFVRSQSQLQVGSRISCKLQKQQSIKVLHKIAYKIYKISIIDGFDIKTHPKSRSAWGKIPFVSRPNLLMTFCCFCRLFMSSPDAILKSTRQLHYFIIFLMFHSDGCASFYIFLHFATFCFSADCRKKK